MLAADSQTCFHCGQPLPPGCHYPVTIDAVTHNMCCPGCQAVAQAIVNGGLGDFYRYRTDFAPNSRELVPAALQALDLYDRPEVQRRFVSTDAQQHREAALILEGITCAACVWLTERHIGSLPGVLEFNVNYTTQRARVRWDESQIKLSAILKAISHIGYLAHPYDPSRQAQVHERERGQALRRLAVAGLGMMQVMMLAVALYAGDYYGMDPDIMHFIRWISLIIATPVVLYAGWPFFASAWRDLRTRRLGMDVPVALAVGSTYLASAWATLSRGGEVYFESATMFVFFLLTGRFLEMRARQQAGEAVESLATLLPAVATRLDADDREDVVAVADLIPGDRVRVRPGETIPADGCLLDGQTSIDESMLTGESLPRRHVEGEELIGGTLNVDTPLVMRVERVGADTVLSGIQRLLDRAQTEKPHIARIAERGTGGFVLLVLLLAAAVGLVWLQIDAERAFWVVVAVLVVSCPCALALATPVALTATTGYLSRLGVLTTRGHALESLARVDTIVFDKTGTLTEGKLRLQQAEALGALPLERCRALAGALETGSEHPVAQALRADLADWPKVSRQQTHTGQGVEGVINGETYRLGNLEFVAAWLAEPGQDLAAAQQPGLTSVYLAGRQGGLLAVFRLGDSLRPEARHTVQALQALGLEVHLLSGDAPATARHLAAQLGIAHAHGGLLPDGKLAALRELQQQGVVVMIGDGVNDAPVLSQAHVSVAMASGSELARTSADMILYSNHLAHLPQAIVQARATLRIIRQNIGWALLYNSVALPIAAAGLITPWLAALGMSLSSLLVVLNALRLRGPSGPGRVTRDE